MGRLQTRLLVAIVVVLSGTALFAAGFDGLLLPLVERARPGDGDPGAVVPAVGTPGGPSRVLSAACSSAMAKPGELGFRSQARTARPIERAVRIRKS